LIFLISCSLFLSSFLAISLTKVNYALFSRKNIIALLAGIIAVPLLFIFTQISRMNLSFGELYELKRVTNHLRIWFFGNLSGFSNWFDNFSFFDQKPAWGQYTFGGIFEVLGLYTRPLGTFDYTYISENFSKTNIYTIFRFLIEDFTIWGTFVIFFLTGFVAKLSYQILMSNRNLIFAGVVSLLYTIIFWSFATSIIMYNAIVFAYLVFVLLLFSFQIYLSKKSEQA
jgi:oligosaccharide repeat unit polymerase